jgi:ribonuclease E
LTVTAPTDVALYLLNSKRDQISAIEEEAGFTIAIKSDGEMIPGDFQLDADKDPKARRRRRKTNRADFLVGDEDDHLLPTEEDDAEEDAELLPASDEDDQETRSDSEGEEGGKRKRRRRGRRGGRRRRRDGIEVGPPPADGGALLDGLSLSLDTMLGDEPPALPEAAEGGLKASAVALPMATKPVSEPEKPEASEATSEDSEGGTGRKRRRRRRKRPNRDEVRTEEAQAEASAEETPLEAESPVDESAEGLEVVTAASDEAEALAPDSDTPSPAETEEAPIVAIEANETASEPVAVDVAVEPEAKSQTEQQPITTEPVLETAAPKKKKRGWWSRG